MRVVVAAVLVAALFAGCAAKANVTTTAIRRTADGGVEIESGKNVDIAEIWVCTPEGYFFQLKGYSSSGDRKIIEAQAAREASDRQSTIEAIKAGAQLFGAAAGTAAKVAGPLP